MKVRLTVTTDGPSLGTVRAEGPGLRLTTGIGVRAGGVAVPASVLPPLVARNWRLSASLFVAAAASPEEAQHHADDEDKHDDSQQSAGHGDAPVKVRKRAWLSRDR